MLTINHYHWRNLSQAQNRFSTPSNSPVTGDSVVFGQAPLDFEGDLYQATSPLAQVPVPALTQVAEHEGYQYLARLIAARQAQQPVWTEPFAPATTQALRLPSPVQPTSTEPVTAAPVAPLGPPITNPKDWHIPSLEETFKLAQRYPGKTIYLDTKTPKDPQVARRMARQIMEQLRKHPDLKERVVVMNPDKGVLDAMKDEFAKNPDFKDFKNFCLDNENLNKWNPSAAERSPLTGSGDNRYVSIGNPKDPLTPNNFDDLVQEVRKAKTQTTDATNSHYGKKVIAWTLNEPDQVRKLVEAGADGILTDDPEMMNRTLDQMGLKPGDPRRPEVIAHRGGPNSKESPENTLPRIEQGLRTSDAIEIDVVSAKDGAVIFHDNDPNSLISHARNLGLEADNKWRPVYPDIGTDVRGKRLDELTVDQIRKNYGFEPNATSSLVANLALSAMTHISRAPGTALNFLGKYLSIGDFNPLGWAGTALNAVVDTVGKPIYTGLAQGLDQAATGIWHGVTTIGRGIGSGFQNIFKGNIAKGLGQIGGGILQGAGKVIGGVAKGVWSAVKGVGNAIGNAAKSVGKFFSKLFG